jgi:hypothetical protein
MCLLNLTDINVKPDHQLLKESEWHQAHKTIAAWKNDQAATHACPRCDAPGLALADYSVRPYAEWFELSCSKCDLDVTMHLPLAPTPGASV